MEVYLVPIKSAFAVFPFIALLFTMPYIVMQYKKFGAIPFLRTVILYSFILYLINMYFFVILPLPPAEEVAQLTGPAMQLTPFQFVSDFIEKSNLDLRDPGTYLGAVTDSSFFVVLFNILLFVPLGIYLRYYFKWNWKKTLAASFGISLFFEITQLSGLYGLYPRPYRLFDVDDLMLNTLGGMTGYWITPILCWFLPSREEIDEIAYEKGERVPLLRRFFALGLDWATLLIGSGVLHMLLHLTEGLLPLGLGAALGTLFSGLSGLILCGVLYFAVLPFAAGGYTFGKWFFRMKLVSDQNDRGAEPRFYQYLIRYGILYGLIFSAPALILGSIFMAAKLPALMSVLLALFVLFLGGLWLLFLWESLAQLFGRSKDYYYGRFSHTRNKNMILRKKRNREGTDQESGAEGETDKGANAQREESKGTGRAEAAPDPSCGDEANIAIGERKNEEKEEE